MALIVDLNNDGLEDLIVGVEGGVVLAQGDGSGSFRIRTVLDTADDVYALAAGDYDLDGRLDLYVGVYYRDEYDRPGDEAVADAGFVYFDAVTGGRNSLFHNEVDGDQWSFRDVTSDVGLDHDNYRFSFAATWEDYDNDGDLDLFVANDYGPKNLFRNDLREDGTRQFADATKTSGAEDRASGMGITWGDYNHDGWMDVYVSNMFSYAGHRITFQDQFRSDADASIKQTLQRFARGNTLLKNLGDGGDDGGELTFEDRSIPSAVNRGRWAWGTAFVDVNNDSWDDLLVTNGYITTEDTGDL
jgi:hypothetical protein